MSTHIDNEQKYSTAVRLLALLGYDLADIHRQHTTKLAEHESGQPTDLDLKYQLQVPKSWASHFEEVPYMSPSTIRVGAQLKLTSGQRKTLQSNRESGGLTPTRTITILDIDCYPGTSAIRTLTLKSNIHVPEHKRRHVLTQWTITSFGDFMQRAYDADVEMNDVKVIEEETKTPVKVARKVKTLEEMYKDYV